MVEHLGFTGTKYGMTRDQWQAVSVLISQLGPENAHHGCCEGADKEFHDLTERWAGIKRHVHPPSDTKLMADCLLREGDVLYDPKYYLRRNKDIVDACSVLIAAPYNSTEILRSGTWSTVRFARTKLPMMRILIVGPDGTVKDNFA